MPDKCIFIQVTINWELLLAIGFSLLFIILKQRNTTDIVYSVLTALINRKFLMIALLIAILPFILYGAKQSWGHTENNVKDWLPKDFPETKQLVEFGKIFGSNEILLIGWEDCKLDSPELTKFKERLLSPQIVGDGSQQVLYEKVVTGQDVYAVLSKEEMRLDEDERLERMQGFLISKDGQKTCMIASISKAGQKYRHEAILNLWTIAKDLGINMDTFHAAGPSLDSVAIDTICRTYLIEMNLASYLIGIIISYLCFRSWRAAMMVFTVSFMNQQMCLALIYWLGIQFDSILMLSVNLTFVLSMSAGIHLTNYYRDAITREEPRQAMFSALKTAIVPTFISIITTIAGLLSFMSSQLVPIRKFGLVSSTALAISVTIIFIFLPIYYIAYPILSWKKEAANLETRSDKRSALEWLFYPWVSRVPALVLTLSGLICIVCFWGATKIQTSIGLYSMLRSYTQPIKDYTWTENQFGPMIPVEVMFTWQKGDDGQVFDRLKFVRNVTNKIKSEMKDVGVISISNFIPDIPDRGAKAVAYRRVFNRKLESAKEGFTSSGYFRELENKQHWRITVRTFAMRPMDYGPIIQQIKDIVGEEIKDELQVASCKLQEVKKEASSEKREARFETTQSGVIAISCDSENLASRFSLLASPSFTCSDQTPEITEDSLLGDMPEIVVDDAADDSQNPDAKSETTQSEVEDNSNEEVSLASRFSPLASPFVAPEVVITGGVPVFFKAQNQLLSDLKVSFLTAFIIIGLILVCLFKSFKCGTLAVYPSLLPVIFVFGLVGWLGIRVEIGTMLTGSAALGIAVDNTVHFITWYRIGHERGLSIKESTQLAYQKCGAAMFQTSSVCSFGLVTYMVSPFIPTIFFSFFMCALLFSALISDLTVLPAILMSAWGIIFLGKKIQDNPPNN